MLTNTLRNLLLTGMGAVSLTKEHAERVAAELLEKGEVTQEEAHKFIAEAQRRGEEEREALRATIQKEIIKFRDEMDLVSKQDLQDLQSRVEHIEKHLNPDNAKESAKEDADK